MSTPATGARTGRARALAVVVVASATIAGSLGMAQSANAAASTFHRCSGMQINNAGGGAGVVVDHYGIRGSTHDCATVRAVARIAATAFAKTGQLPARVVYRHKRLSCTSGARPFTVRRATCAKRYRFDVTPRTVRTPMLDGFARAPGALGSGWQSPGLQDTGTMTIAAAGSAQGVLGAAGSVSGADGGNGASSATWNVPFGPDQEAYLTVRTLPAVPGDWVQVAGRVNTRANSHISCYFLRVTPSTNRWDLRQKLSGEESISLRSFIAPLAAGDSLGLQIKGSTLTAYRRSGIGPWMLVGTAPGVTSSMSGFISFTLQGATAQASAFGGGTTPAT